MAATADAGAWNAGVRPGLGGVSGQTRSRRITAVLATAVVGAGGGSSTFFSRRWQNVWNVPSAKCASTNCQRGQGWVRTQRAGYPGVLEMFL